MPKIILTKEMMNTTIPCSGNCKDAPCVPTCEHSNTTGSTIFPEDFAFWLYTDQVEYLKQRGRSPEYIEDFLDVLDRSIGVPDLQYE